MKLALGSHFKSKLKIAVDVTWMDEYGAVGGGFQYSERLIYSLVQNTDHTIIVLVREKGKRIFQRLMALENFSLKCIDDEISFFKVITDEKIDILHSPVQLYTLYLNSIPMVTTLHDLQHYHYPEFFSNEELAIREIIYKKVAFASQRIIVSYKHVKNDIVNFFHINPLKIDVCPVGVDVPDHVDINKVGGIKTKYKIPEEYLLYCANVWVHKNHISLIRALKVIHQKYNNNLSLIFTGKTNEIDLYKNQYEILIKEVQKLELTAYVRFLGYIPEEDKILILNNASIVAVPTLYEAGSFPLMEAMNYGVPVVCSNVTSLPDQIGDNRFVFDPMDIVDIAQKVMNILTDENLKKENIENSKKMITGLRWENIVDNFLNSYELAIKDFNKKNIIIKKINRIQDNLKFYFLPETIKIIRTVKPIYQFFSIIYRFINKILK